MSPCLARCAEAHGGYSVFAGVGERTREGNDLYKVNSSTQPASHTTAVQPPHVFAWTLTRMSHWLLSVLACPPALSEQEMITSGVIKLDGESKAALVYGQMNEPPRRSSASCSDRSVRG